MLLLMSCATTNNSPKQPQPSISYPSESSAVLYVNQRLSFSMEIPIGWLVKLKSKKHMMFHIKMEEIVSLFTISQHTMTTVVWEYCL